MTSFPSAPPGINDQLSPIRSSRPPSRRVRAICTAVAPDPVRTFRHEQANTSSPHSQH